MARGPLTFRQRDVVRLVKAATAAGLRVSGVRVDAHTGIIEVVTGTVPEQDSRPEMAGAETKSDQIIL